LSKTVLIVDDAYFMRNLLKKALKEAGYEVVGEAKNGKEGIKFYFELKPDIVTMDINMPDISGIEATKQIMSKDPKAKIIAVTGNNDDDIKRQILEAGAKEYLQKPFQPAFLWSKLEKMLEEPVEELEVEPEIVPVKEEKPESPISVVVGADAVEDDFDEMEIEIMDKPDESKSMTFVIENEEDSIEFPEDYQELVVEEQEEFGLTKENLERVEEEEELLIELEDNQTLVELKEDEQLIEIEVAEQPTPVVKELTIRRPVVEQTVPKPPIQPKRPEPTPVVAPKAPKRHVQEQTVAPSPAKKETLVSTVEITKSKAKDRKIEEINIRPQGTYSSDGREVNIRPPRGKLLRGDDRFDTSDDVEEPILNVSDKDNYNDTNDGLFGIVKKLFKK
jgi:CheY-like chemotaxis protein